jgi:molybdate transport system substrate-binding protein
MRRIFSRIAVAAFFLPLAVLCASAAEIHVVAPAGTAFGMQSLAKSFTQETGTVVDFDFPNAVAIPGMLDGDAPVDLVVLPAADMDAAEQKGTLKAGTKTALGRVEIAFLVKKGAPHPDVSTPEKLRAALLAEGPVAVNDPAAGSTGGVIVARMLKDPQFAGVKTVSNNGPAFAITHDSAKIGLQLRSEVNPTLPVEVVAPIPASLQAHLDFSVAIAAKSTAPDAGRAFLHYITRPQAAAVWKSAGLDR